MTESIEKLIKRLKALLINDIDLRPVDHLHISLTRTVILRHHWIESFIDLIRQNLSSVKR